MPKLHIMSRENVISGIKDKRLAEETFTETLFNCLQLLTSALLLVQPALPCFCHTFTSFVTKNSLKFQKCITCSYSNVVYILACPKCNIQHAENKADSLDEREIAIRHADSNSAAAGHFADGDYSILDLAFSAVGMM